MNYAKTAIVDAMTILCQNFNLEEYSIDLTEKIISLTIFLKEVDPNV